MADLRGGTYRFDRVFPRSFSSEFPHDNPALSTGVVWTCQNPCSPASPRREPEAPTPGVLVFGPEGAVSEADAWGIRLRWAKRSSRPPRAVIAEAPIAEVPAPPVAPVAETLASSVAAEVPVVADAETLHVAPTPRNDPFARLLDALSDVALHAGATKIAAALPSLFSSSRTTLIDGAPLDPETRELLVVGAAWRDVLSGASCDLGACGERTLDEWGAALLARLLGRSHSATRELRQRLRDHGVAAFGFRDAA